MTEPFRDLVRRFAATGGPEWRKNVLEILGVLKVIYENAAKGNDKDLRLKNPKIDKYIVSPPGVLDLFLRVSPFTREHLVGDNLNEFVLRPKTGELLKCLELSSACETLLEEETTGRPWWDELKINIKVLLPRGEELQGSFSENETVQDLREWVQRRMPTLTPETAIGDDDIHMDAGMDDMLLGQLYLNRKRLLVKMDGDLGRAKMEETEAKRKLDAEAERKKLQDQFAKQKQEKDAAREAEKQKRVTNLARFEQDRIAASRRVELSVREVARSSQPSPPATVASQQLDKARDKRA